MATDKTMPIAIIGMNLKFPGDAVSAQAFWELVMSARNVSKRIPADRFNIDGMQPNLSLSMESSTSITLLT